MSICVMSYNRGEYLQNCIASIEACAPDTYVAIFDDKSDDPKTLGVLQRLREEHDVFVADRNDRRNSLGGLYAGMQAAVDRLHRDHRYLLFIQDDMQFVRPYLSADDEAVLDYFKFSECPFLNVNFLKQRCFDDGLYEIEFDSRRGIYRNTTGDVIGRHFTAVAAIDTLSLLRSGWTFCKSEIENAIQAATKFGPLGYFRNPFVMFLPEVPVYRQKAQTMAALYQRFRGEAAVNPFAIMTLDEATAFCHRRPADLPVAETYLRTTRPTRVFPYAYSAIETDPVLFRLHRAELKLRRGLRKLVN